MFYGREDTLERLNEYMTGDDDKPIVLYGEGGCGKTSLLAKTAGLTSSQWFVGVKPINIIRFLGTTPDSSALTPTLISLCQQVIYTDHLYSYMSYLFNNVELGKSKVNKSKLLSTYPR